MSKVKHLVNIGILAISLVLSVSSFAASSAQGDIANATTASVTWHGGSGIFG